MLTEWVSSSGQKSGTMVPLYLCTLFVKDGELLPIHLEATKGYFSYLKKWKMQVYDWSFVLVILKNIIYGFGATLKKINHLELNWKFSQENLEMKVFFCPTNHPKYPIYHYNPFHEMHSVVNKDSSVFFCYSHTHKTPRYQNCDYRQWSCNPDMKQSSTFIQCNVLHVPQTERSWYYAISVFWSQDEEVQVLVLSLWFVFHCILHWLSVSSFEFTQQTITASLCGSPMLDYIFKQKVSLVVLTTL